METPPEGGEEEEAATPATGRCSSGAVRARTQGRALAGVPRTAVARDSIQRKKVQASSNGAWTGARATKRVRGHRRARRPIWRLDALLAEGCEHIEWNGRDPKLIVDAEGRIIAVLLGRPEGEDWDDVIKEMERIMAGVRRRGRKRGIFQSKSRSHRRGIFDLMSEAFSMGSGQRRPGNLVHTKEYRRLLRHFLENRAIQRIAGFQSSGVGRYFPKLWNYMADTMQGIQQNQPGLCRPFNNSVYPAVTFNLGPDTVTAEHRDSHNLAHGGCPITSGGDYNHKNGGHLYMRQLKVVIEFPSGSSMAILSSAVDHGNTPIAKGETRYSMTQYAAGALFRWAAFG
ncbi:hypothetical protein B0H10DRAFT_903678 [Mycena sp. CBHHK59/15]|nr:hypothetical protein B0H10DRAFT_903678 [Mycena sp. CBHHK59/15]